MSAHILIIEDNEMSLALAEYLLRQAGYTVSSATDGRSGMHRALQNDVHLILCDLDLPVMEGSQVVQALRANGEWRKVPVLAFTAASMNDAQRRALDADFDGCVAKPVDPTVFAASIDPFLAPELRASQG
jgi:CheY-like chemotaxis protein